MEINMKTISRAIFLFIFGIFILTACIANRSGSSQSIIIVNDTNETITSAHFRAEGTTDWGNNLIKRNINPGGSKRVKILSTTINGRYDIQLRASTDFAFTKEIQFPTQSKVLSFKYTDSELGPAGGFIFYDKGHFSDGWRYLEVAPADYEFTAQWSERGQDVTETLQIIGSGQQNTILVVNRLSELDETGSAAQICDELTINGFSDWFLPSKDELDLIFQKLHKVGLGGFSDTWYWSSSEYRDYTAWGQGFNTGDSYNYPKHNTLSVRAIRAF
jgi:hypothetical protein